MFSFLRKEGGLEKGQKGERKEVGVEGRIKRKGGRTGGGEEKGRKSQRRQRRGCRDEGDGASERPGPAAGEDEKREAGTPAPGWRVEPQRLPRVGDGDGVGRRSRPARAAHLGVRGRRALERGDERAGHRRPWARECAAAAAAACVPGRGVAVMDTAAAQARSERAPSCPRGYLRTEGRRGLRGRTCHRGGSQGGGRTTRAPASSSGPTAP